MFQTLLAGVVTAAESQLGVSLASAGKALAAAGVHYVVDQLATKYGPDVEAYIESNKDAVQSLVSDHVLQLIGTTAAHLQSTPSAS